MKLSSVLTFVLLIVAIGFVELKAGEEVEEIIE